MKREDIDKLIGGYATGSLTPEERDALFSAALEDQHLFNQLMAEEPLREVLAEPAARDHLLAVLDTAPEPWYRRMFKWLGRPGGLAAAAVAAALVIAATVYVQYEPWRPRPAVLTELRRAEKPFEPPALAQPDLTPEPLPPPPRLAPTPAQKDISEMAERAPASPEPAVAPPGREAAGGVVGGVVGGFAREKQEASRNMARATGAAAPAPPPPPAKAAAPIQTAEAGSPSARALFDASPAAMNFAAAEEKEQSRLKRATPTPQAARDGVRRQDAGTRTLARSSAAALPVPHLGLRYTVLRRAPDGQFTEVDPSTVFTVGEPLRLLFEPNDSGYLYILQREAGGGWRQLFGEAVPRRARVQVPSTGALVYEEPGTKELYAVFSRTPEPAFANLQPGVLDQRLRGSLLLQKSPEKALYVVNTSSAPQSQQVAFAITLSVRQP